MFPFHRLLFWFSVSYREQSRTGIRHRNWVVPSDPGENGSRLVDLGRRNQKSEAARWLGKARRDGKDQRKSFNSAEGNYIVGLGKGFGAGGLYIDVRQCKGADNFAQERGFLMLDSIRVIWISGAQSLIGIPGNPAPEPRSAASRELRVRSTECRVGSDCAGKEGSESKSKS